MSSLSVKHEVMTYFGAGLDIFPLVALATWTAVVGHYVYIDGMPDSGYSPRWPTVKKMLETLVGAYNDWSVGQVVSVLEVIPNEYWRLDLGGAKLHYFINTTDSDVVRGDVPDQLKDLLRRTTHMFFHGFTPDKRVMSLIPAAAEPGGLTIYASDRSSNVADWHHEHIDKWKILGLRGFRVDTLITYEYFILKGEWYWEYRYMDLDDEDNDVVGTGEDDDDDEDDEEDQEDREKEEEEHLEDASASVGKACGLGLSAAVPTARDGSCGKLQGAAHSHLGGEGMFTAACHPVMSAADQIFNYTHRFSERDVDVPELVATGHQPVGRLTMQPKQTKRDIESMIQPFTGITGVWHTSSRGKKALHIYVQGTRLSNYWDLEAVQAEYAAVGIDYSPPSVLIEELLPGLNNDQLSHQLRGLLYGHPISKTIEDNLKPLVVMAREAAYMESLAIKGKGGSGKSTCPSFSAASEAPVSQSANREGSGRAEVATVALGQKRDWSAAAASSHVFRAINSDKETKADNNAEASDSDGDEAAASSAAKRARRRSSAGIDSSGTTPAVASAAATEGL